MRQIEVINQETIIDVTAETSNVEILVRDYDSELVERFALEAQEAAIDAEESADIANAQASIATAQAGIATTQAGIATTQAGIATTQSGIATTKANEASASAASALASEQSADADRILAQNAATTATTQAGIATTQAGIATTKAVEASDSAASALASETDAETAASTATTQAGIATTQAGIATTQAGNALTSANNAAASAASAASAALNTPLTGFTTGANSTILATDTTLQAFGKAQGQINARVSGTGASGQVAFWNGTSSQTGDNGLFWNNTNKRLGIGTTTPADNLEIIGGSGAGISLTATAGTGNITVLKDNNFVALRADGTSGFIAYGVTTAGSRVLRFVGNGTEVARFFTSGNLLLQNGGTFTDAGFRLDVNGTARVQGELTVGNGTDSIIRANSSVISSFQTTTLQASNSNISTMLDIRPNGSSSSLTGFYLRDSSTAANGSNIVIVGRGNATLPSTGVTYLGALISGVPSANSLHLGFLVSNTSAGRIEAARIWNSGNVLIQAGGTYTDAGFRLDVNGTARVQGVLNVSTGGAAIVGNTTIRSGQEGLRLGGDNNGQTVTNNTDKRGRISVPQYGSTTGLPIGIILGATNVSSNSVQIGGIQGGYTLAADSIEFFVGATYNATTSNQIARFFSTGNLLLQNGGTFTDAGFRLDVNGTARVQGELTVNGVNIGIGGGAITSNTRFGTSALASNTTGVNNVANGFQALQSNTTGVNNLANGYNALQLNTTGGSNTVNGSRSLQNNTTGSNNIAIGTNSGRFIADGTTALTIASNSVFLGFDSRANADNQTNQIVIGHTAIGLGSNTTVLGNSSTTFGRWFGSLLLGTTTNAASSILTMESTTQGFLPPRMTTTQKNAIATPATGLVVYDTTLNKLSVRTASTWETVTSL